MWDHLFSFDHFSYINEEGYQCLNNEGFQRILGIGNSVDLLVSYNATNSPYIVLWVRWNSPLAIVMILLDAIVVVVVLATFYDVIAFRHKPIYRVSSPSFLLLILVGMLIALAAPFAWIGKPNRVTCMLPWWLLSTGLSLIFSCLIAKNWRIYRIFASTKWSAIEILDSQLISRWLAATMTVQFAILICWTIFFPLIPQQSGSSALAFDELQITCQEKKTGRTIGTVLVLFYQCCLLVIVAVISFKVRTVKQEYRESQAIGMIVIASLSILCILAFLSNGFPTLYHVSFLIATVGTLLLVLIVYASIFLPKIRLLHLSSSSSRHPKKNSHDSAQFLSTLSSHRDGSNTRANVGRADTLSPLSSNNNNPRQQWRSFDVDDGEDDDSNTPNTPTPHQINQ